MIRVALQHRKMILGGPRGDKNYVRTDRVQITKKMTDSMEQLRNSLTLPTRVNTVISISRAEVSFGEYVVF